LAPGCTTSVAIAATPGVAYQDLVTAMDRAVKAGLPDLGLTAPKDLAVKFDDTAAHEKSAPPHCTAVAASTAKPAPAGAAISKPDAPLSEHARRDLAAAPVVIITRTDVELDGASLGAVKSLARGK